MSVEIGVGHWRNLKQQYVLWGEVCPNCDEKIFPPRDVCPNCGEEAKELHQFSGRGEVYSFTIVEKSAAPEDFVNQAPYPVALIRLEEGPLITAQLTDVDLDKIGIGMSVEMVTRKLSADGNKGQIKYGYKFRPRLLTKEQEVSR